VRLPRDPHPHAVALGLGDAAHEAAASRMSSTCPCVSPCPRCVDLVIIVILPPSALPDYLYYTQLGPSVKGPSGTVRATQAARARRIARIA
jgi:hypothetical protein